VLDESTGEATGTSASSHDGLNKDQVSSVVGIAVQKAVERAEEVLAHEREQNTVVIKKLHDDYHQQIEAIKDKFAAGKQSIMSAYAEKAQKVTEQAQKANA